MYADFCELPTHSKQHLPNPQPCRLRGIWSTSDRMGTPPIEDFWGDHTIGFRSFGFHSSEPFRSERHFPQLIRDQKEDDRRVHVAFTFLEKRDKRCRLQASVWKKDWHSMMMWEGKRLTYASESLEKAQEHCENDKANVDNRNGRMFVKRSTEDPAFAA